MVTPVATPQPRLVRTYETEDGQGLSLTYELGGIELYGTTYPSGRTATRAILQAVAAEAHLEASVDVDARTFDVDPPWISIRIDVATGIHHASVEVHASVRTARELHASLTEALRHYQQPALPLETP